MGRWVAALVYASTFIALSTLVSQPALAAGAVEMQVERLVVQMIDEYNEAMENGDPQPWLRYFADNVLRHSPLSEQQGKQAFSDYYAGEFKAFQAKYAIKKVLVSGRSAAVTLDWEGVHKVSGTPVKVEMAAIYEMNSSGRFESVSFYFDTVKVAQLFASAESK